MIEEEHHTPADDVRELPQRLRHRDIEILHDLLLEWCSDNNSDPNGADALAVTRELADPFDLGVRDYATLREAIASR